jgi:hypothetical protein
MAAKIEENMKENGEKSSENVELASKRAKENGVINNEKWWRENNGVSHRHRRRHQALNQRALLLLAAPRCVAALFALSRLRNNEIMASKKESE